jgi:hypothetical protein
MSDARDAMIETLNERATYKAKLHELHESEAHLFNCLLSAEAKLEAARAHVTRIGEALGMGACSLQGAAIVASEGETDPGPCGSCGDCLWLELEAILGEPK